VICGGCRLLHRAVRRLPRSLQNRLRELHLESGAALGTNDGLRSVECRVSIAGTVRVWLQVKV
jgi:hypothetical protein